MADNVQFQTTVATPASGTLVAGKEVTFSGDTTKVQLVELVGVTGSEGSRTLNEISNASGVIIQDGGNTITVDGTVAVTGVATTTKQDEQSVLLGAVTETAPATDTASSGLNGRLQRIAQRLTSLIALLVQFVTGGGTEAAALRVTVASDSTGVLSVDDNGASLTVDGTVAVSGTVAVTQSGTWDEVGINDSGNSITVDAPVGTPAFVRLSDGSAAITTLPVSLASVPSHAVTNAGTFAVQENGAALTALAAIQTAVETLDNTVGGTELQVDIVSAPTLTVNAHAVTNAGTFAVQVDGSALTALQLIDNIVQVEDAAASGGESGVQMLAVRKDSGGTLASTDGDFTPLQVDSDGNLRIRVVAGGGTGGTSATDDAAFTAASGSGTPIMGFVTSDSVDSGDVGVVGMLANRQLKVTLYDSSGSELAVGGGTQYTEDAAAAANPVGNALMLVREDARGGSLTTTDGDNVAARGNNKGELYVKTTDSDALLTTIDADTSALAGTVAGSEMQVDIVSAPTLTVNAHAVTNAGTFATQESGALLTAAQLIDDTVAVLGTATYTEATTKGNVIGAVRRDADTTLVDTTNEIGPLQMDANGRLKVEAFSGETLPVSLASVPSHAVTNAGTFAVQVDGSALTALQLIDDVVFAEDVAAQAADKGVAILAVRRDADTSLVGTDNDYANLQVDANGYLKVEIFDGGGSHTVDNAGTFAVQVDGSALTALQLIDNPVLVDDAAFTPATSSVSMAGFQADEASTDSVDEGDAGAARMTLDRKVIVNPQPHTAGGLSIFRSLDLDESEEDVKTSAGQVYGWAVTNTATSTRWLKFYNATAANVTVGSTTPVITWGIPGNSSDDISANVLGAMGIAFDTAICVAATTGVADADTGAPAANDVIVNIFYK